MTRPGKVLWLVAWDCFAPVLASHFVTPGEDELSDEPEGDGNGTGPDDTELVLSLAKVLPSVRLLLGVVDDQSPSGNGDAGVFQRVHVNLNLCEVKRIPSLVCKFSHFLYLKDIFTISYLYL